MELFTKATVILSSTTFIGYLGLRHLRKAIKEVPLPPSSILHQYFQQAKNSNPNDGHFADSFQAQLPSNVVEHIRKNKENKLNVDTCVRSFYTSWIFKIEKTIMKVISKQHEPDLSSLEIGTSIYLWRVETRNDEEILLVWEQGPVKGSTWFYLSPKENVIMFGSSIQILKNLDKRKQLPTVPSEYSVSNNVTSKPAEYEGNELPSLKDEINDKSFKGKVMKTIKSIAWTTVLGFHRTYSMIILNGILTKITKQAG